MLFRNLTLAIISILLVHPVTPSQRPVAALDRNDPELRAILTAKAERTQAKVK